MARIIIGPYPAESDFRLLKQNNVGLVVSLLEPAIPYEATLLKREKVDALGGLGPTYYRAGRRDDAIRRLSEAPAITPGNHELRDALARAEASK